MGDEGVSVEELTLNDGIDGGFAPVACHFRFDLMIFELVTTRNFF